MSKVTYTGPLKSGNANLVNKGHVVSVARIDYNVTALTTTGTASAKKIPKKSYLIDIFYAQPAAITGSLAAVYLGYSASGNGRFDLNSAADGILFIRYGTWTADVDKNKWMNTGASGSTIYKSVDAAGTGSASFFILMANGGAL